MTEARFVQEVEIVDPDSGQPVSVAIYKDPVSGGLFGIDSSYVEQVRDDVPNPFGNGGRLRLP